MSATIAVEIINTPEQIGRLVDQLVDIHVSPLDTPAMYIDIEGVALCREGSISIFTLLIDTGSGTTPAFLIDVHILGAQAFNTPGTRDKTLKDVLQDESVIKVFFDVRNDSDALFAHFGVALQGIEDVQLMESATRRTRWSRRFVTGLANCIEQNISAIQREVWFIAKYQGERLFKAQHGGSYDVFNQRPMSKEIISYCIGDVQYLPELRRKFWTHPDQWKKLVMEATAQRVVDSQKLDYQPLGRKKALAPWTSKQNNVLDQWYLAPTCVFDWNF
ncbi:hypothetical protein K504DRAFT_463143 [Pleomassaria siparia CBS 279.74]|uniref:3'-5' exonuclease domain-containing protein n=1 Tax=Pleomassaria siparia CBS 279.74 TaxID=1314801 RepID=A0A6G1JUR2_9PLEO|nr:hypothetical protein K504DRAFT_463143 [Pleomassaria siparia CBS 279.74]